MASILKWSILAAALGAMPAAGLAGQPQAPTPQQLKFDRRSPVVLVVERVKGSVVNISSTRLVRVSGAFSDELFRRFFGDEDPFSRTVEATSLGSGVVIHPSGYVLTNAHVVARAATITCSFSKQKEYKARLISADTAHDLAVLKIDLPAGEPPLPHAPMGSADDLLIGETVIAIGNPLGYSHTVTTGVISAIGREIQLTKELKLADLIQTDASINPGNSGGPLLNINGELIGINTAIRGDAQNIGFAIPISRAREYLGDLLDFARVNDLLFGATLADEPAGPTVRRVAAGSPAEKAGLKVGDRILAVDGTPVRSLVEFNVLMLARQAGQASRFLVARPGSADLRLSVELVRAPKPDGNALMWSRFGMKARPLDKDEAQRLNLREGVGMIINELDKGSEAANVGLEVGDVLVQIDRLGINSADDLGQALKEVRPGQAVRMAFLRDRWQISLNLKAK